MMLPEFGWPRRTASPPQVLRTFVLQIIGPPFRDVDHVVEMAQTVNTALDEAEENLTDLLPEGYSVRITEWDE